MNTMTYEQATHALDVIENAVPSFDARLVQIEMSKAVTPAFKEAIAGFGRTYVENCMKTPNTTTAFAVLGSATLGAGIGLATIYAAPRALNAVRSLKRRAGNILVAIRNA